MKKYCVTYQLLALLRIHLLLSDHFFYAVIFHHLLLLLSSYYHTVFGGLLFQPLGLVYLPELFELFCSIIARRVYSFCKLF